MRPSLLIALMVLLTQGVCMADYQKSGFINWNDGVEEVSYDPETEDYSLINLTGNIMSSDSVGTPSGLMFTGFKKGKEKVIIYDKRTGKVKRELQ